MPAYVQYGSGYLAPEGWISFDASPTLRLQRLPLVGSLFARRGVVFSKDVRYGDIVAGLPVADDSADGVYASHVLEHLPYDDFWIALRNTFRILKPGGIFRLIVPDLEARARRYVAGLDRGESGGNDWFMRASHLGRQARGRGLGGYLREAVGYNAHLWMWDERSMAQALAATGFVDIRRAAFNDCADPHFRLVELADRFHDEGQDIEECAMEARKPAPVIAPA